MVAALLFTVLAVVAGVLVIWGSRTRARRERLLPIVAQHARMSFSEVDQFNCAAVPFPLFRAGDGRHVENVMWREGTNGTAVRVFDYGYYVERRDNAGFTTRTWSYFSCATTEHGGSWPPIRIGPEGMVRRLAEHLGMRHIDLESEEFNRMFVVHCDDPKFATALLDPQMMEFLLSTGGALELSTKGRFLLVSCPRLDDARLVPGLAQVAETFIAHVPPVVRELYPDFPKGGPDTTDMAAPADATDTAGNPANWLFRDIERTEPEPFMFAPAPDFHSPASLDPTPGVDHDLDGHVVTPHEQDPWGEGRDLAGDP